MEERHTKVRYLVKYVYDCGTVTGTQLTNEFLYWTDKSMYIVNEMIREDMNESKTIMEVHVYEMRDDSYIIRPVNHIVVKKEGEQ